MIGLVYEIIKDPKAQQKISGCRWGREYLVSLYKKIGNLQEIEMGEFKSKDEFNTILRKLDDNFITFDYGFDLRFQA